MIQDLIKLENCRIEYAVDGWKEAIHMALQPLLETGFITPEYEEAVLENTEKFGPYYVLTPDLALIHAGPDRGVLETQMAVTLLREPVQFTPDGHKVRVLAALAAKDKNAHMDGIRAVSNIFMDDEKTNAVLNAADSQTLYDLFVANAGEQ